MYALFFFHPKKRNRKRIRHKQKHMEFGPKSPFFHAHPHLFSVLGVKKEKKKLIAIKNKFTTLPFPVPFLSLWDTMMLTWSIIPHPPCQILNTNFLLLSIFQPQSALSLAVNCPPAPVPLLYSCQKAQLKVRTCWFVGSCYKAKGAKYSVAGYSLSYWAELGPLVMPPWAVLLLNQEIL